MFIRPARINALGAKDAEMAEVKTRVLITDRATAFLIASEFSRFSQKRIDHQDALSLLDDAAIVLHAPAAALAAQLGIALPKAVEALPEDQPPSVAIALEDVNGVLNLFTYTWNNRTSSPALEAVDRM